MGTTFVFSDRPAESVRKYGVLTDYLKNKGYKYIDLIDNKFIKREISPDIIFYQEPYSGVLRDELFIKKNKYALYCYVFYGFSTIYQDYAYNKPLHNLAWHCFCENEMTIECGKKLSDLKGKNFVATGLPMTDLLMSRSEDINNPWKPQGKKKRIIWAPHHSIPTINNAIMYSVFLNVADDFLRIAEKYKKEIQMAFKPHPDLKKKLYVVWGQERTDDYYEKWARLENGQIEQGEYIGLFKYSDAMIHDCGSFTVEYLYMNKPVMYLVNGTPHEEGLTEFGKQAFKQHYLGRTAGDIEKFILNVINEEDTMFEQRTVFYRECLLPPYGKTACENIINAILGEKEYSHLN